MENLENHDWLCLECRTVTTIHFGKIYEGCEHYMKLSKSFTLEELTKTNTGIPKVCSHNHVLNLFYLANFILQPTRDRFGRLDSSSGFRSRDVNLEVGGDDESDHLSGGADDFIPAASKINEVFLWMYERLVFGQLILEFHGGKEWIHVSLPRQGKGNQEAFIYRDGIYHPYNGLED